MKTMLRSCALAAVCILVSAIAVADCGGLQDPVENIICANPNLAALDSKMAAAYVAAGERDPTRAAGLSADQRNWLGMRNRVAWNDAQTNAMHNLANLYQSRITFLRSVDNPAATRDLPVAQKLLVAIPAVQMHIGDLVDALGRSGAVKLPAQRNIQTLAGLIAALPAPPAPRLRAALAGLHVDAPGTGGATLVYLPQARLGGMFTVIGTGLFQDWVTFVKRGDETVKIPSGFVPSVISGRDGGTIGYLANIDGEPVAITETDAFNRPIADLQWRRWANGHWGPTIRLRVRFAQTSGDGRPCTLPSSQTCITAAHAQRAVRRYLQNPWSLLDPAWLTASQRARFELLQNLAQNQAAERARAYNVDYLRSQGFWFPAHIDGQVVAGRIADGHIGSHPQSGWSVEFWGRWTPKLAVALPSQYITPKPGRVLAVARMPPAPDERLLQPVVAQDAMRPSVQNHFPVPG